MSKSVDQSQKVGPLILTWTGPGWGLILRLSSDCCSLLLNARSLSSAHIALRDSERIQSTWAHNLSGKSGNAGKSDDGGVTGPSPRPAHTASCLGADALPPNIPGLDPSPSSNLAASCRGVRWSCVRGPLLVEHG